jgi:hypothetical protein
MDGVVFVAVVYTWIFILVMIVSAGRIIWVHGIGPWLERRRRQKAWRTPAVRITRLKNVRSDDRRAA